MSCTLVAVPLYVNDELRAITARFDSCDRSVMMSSEIPSLKYSCSGSPLMFSNGSTAMDGLSGSGKAMRSTDAGSSRGAHGSNHHASAPSATTATAARTLTATPRPRARAGAGLDASGGGIDSPARTATRYTRTGSSKPLSSRSPRLSCTNGSRGGIAS